MLSVENSEGNGKGTLRNRFLQNDGFQIYELNEVVSL